MPSILITFYGFSSKQRWRLQYRRNTPFTVVYFRHILWFFINAKAEATIPTQHTFHSRLFSSHSTAFSQHRDGGYNTDSTHLSLPYIFIVKTEVEATVPTQHTFHCRLFSSHSTDFRQNRGGGYNTDSTHLLQSFIFVTLYGFSSTQRWRLQYRLNTPFTAVYFRHILRIFVNAKVEVTIPSQHTFHCRLFSSHSTWVSPMVSFPQVSLPEPCAHLSPPPYAPHATPMVLIHSILKAAFCNFNINSIPKSPYTGVHAMDTGRVKSK